MNLPVAILAGGLATRLKPLSEHHPKVLIEVAGKPFALHQLELLKRQGFKKVVFCVGHLGERVRDVLKDGRHWNIDLQYSFDGPTLLGTGGALKKASHLLGEAFFVMYGDSYLECDYSKVEKAFCKSGKPGLMTIFHNANRWEKSNVILRNGRIVIYDKFHQTPEMQYIDYGLGILHKSVFDSVPEDQPVDLSTIYQDLLSKNELVGYEVKNRFYEIGSPVGLEEIRRYLTRKRNPRGVFLDRDGVINKVVMRNGIPGSPRTINEFEWEDGAINAIETLKDHGFSVIVVSNQPDISRGDLGRDNLDEMTQKIYNQTPVDAVLTCPHDDIDSCNCRKPKAGMLYEASENWGIDFRYSFMVGDSWKDMDAGKTAQCTTILIDKPYNRETNCDFRVRRLEDAVKIILKSQQDSE